MIKESLKYIATELDDFLKRKYNSQESRVQLGAILDQGGAIPEENRNKVLVTLVNLEHETTTNTTLHGRVNSGKLDQYYPPLSFNMNILFSGLFNQYEESLKFISDTIYFFQAKPIFNAQNSPNLDSRVLQLTLEVLKLNSNETYNLWSSMGAKYVPSIVFKVRMLTFQADQVMEIVSIINTQGVEARPV
ncbi:MULTISPECIES: DUF4255 domain-containing protein [Roseivirga]|jgi:hypothetical protein|uniref:DUF4255 domain-containing protein n=1 Tax=Roseivirga TaxID=290180 RepID=UPI0025798C46|nr:MULTISPECIES: DUF4255 domain-containing protein [Roseivirga]|tara:strand:+ start:4225 stop:4794 length:570 start_codon:yes stop_codon:yes gene_type:complete